MVQAHIRDGQQLRSQGETDPATERFRTAFEVLVRNYQNIIVGFCTNMLRGRSGNAEDIAQDIFLASWRAMPDFRHEASVRTWLFSIARYKCLDAIADAGRMPTVDEDAVPESVDLTQSDPERDERRELRVWLNRGLAQLTSDDREILIMSYVTELAPTEITIILGLTEGGVRTRRKRALDRLRKVIAQGEERA